MQIFQTKASFSMIKWLSNIPSATVFLQSQTKLLLSKNFVCGYMWVEIPSLFFCDIFDSNSSLIRFRVHTFYQCTYQAQSSIHAITSKKYKYLWQYLSNFHLNFFESKNRSPNINWGRISHCCFCHFQYTVKDRIIRTPLCEEDFWGYFICYLCNHYHFLLQGNFSH